MFPQADVSTLKDTTILYIEDENDIKDATSEILNKFVNRILLASDGKEGLEIFKNNSDIIDIVITDINMPKMDGLEMSREIKQINNNIPIIVTSAYSDTNYMLDSIEIGIDKYVLKPIDIEQLIKTMTHSLHYYHLKDLYTDSLTKLKNRNFLLKNLKAQIVDPQCMACIDIDRLTIINDIYGFEIGDKVILDVANKLKAQFNEENGCGVYSLEADIFIITSSSKDHEDFSAKIGEFQHNIQFSTIIIDDCEIHLTLSIGCADFRFGKGLKLFNNTMRALQYSIEYKKPKIVYTDEIGIGQSYKNNVKWIREITNFSKDKHFTVFLQPTYHNGSSDISYFKALFRHIDNEGNITDAKEFLDIIKKAKLFSNVIKMVLEEVIELLRLNSELKLAMVISFDDLNDPDVYAYVLTLLKNNKDISSRLIFVLSESEEITNYEVVNNFILDVKQYNTRVGLDNFGAKYSNFNLLTKLNNISYIKIDKSIVEEIENDEAKRLLIDIIVAYCEEEGIETIAGYIENDNLYRIIRMTGVDYIQGYYLGKPQHPEAFDLKV
jgi:diguanylate cyclase (GGDEF)-like protein